MGLRGCGVWSWETQCANMRAQRGSWSKVRGTDERMLQAEGDRGGSSCLHGLRAAYPIAAQRNNIGNRFALCCWPWAVGERK